MARVKSGKTTRVWHKKVLKLTKGSYGARSKHFSKAVETMQHAGNYAYRDRRNRKRDFRRLWIQRINAATREHGISYSVFMNGLKKANVAIDRKQLSELAIHDPAAFARIAELVRASIPAAAS